MCLRKSMARKHAEIKIYFAVDVPASEVTDDYLFIKDCLDGFISIAIWFCLMLWFVS